MEGCDCCDSGHNYAFEPRWMSHCVIARSSFCTPNMVDSISMENISQEIEYISKWYKCFVCADVPEMSLAWNVLGVKGRKYATSCMNNFPLHTSKLSETWQIVNLVHEKSALQKTKGKLLCSGTGIIVIHWIQRADVNLWLVMRRKAQCHSLMTHAGRNKQWGTEHKIPSSRSRDPNLKSPSDVIYTVNACDNSKTATQISITGTDTEANV